MTLLRTFVTVAFLVAAVWLYTVGSQPGLAFAVVGGFACEGIFWYRAFRKEAGRDARRSRVG